MPTILGLGIPAVINEHYTVIEYIQCRAGWLGTHPDSACMPIGRFTIARRDASDVFSSDSALSVQEVRQREQDRIVDPLLPFPTIGNTESLDGFRSYPGREWSPSIRRPLARPATPEQEPALEATSRSATSLCARQSGNRHHDTSATQHTSQRPVLQPSSSTLPCGSTPVYGPQQSPRASLTGGKMPSANSVKANMLQTAYADQQASTSFYIDHHQPGRSSSPVLRFGSPMATIASTPATTPPLGGSKTSTCPSQPPHATDKPLQADLLRNNINALGNPPRLTDDTTSLEIVEGNIASLAGRGIMIPIKQSGAPNEQHRHHQKLQTVPWRLGSPNRHEQSLVTLRSALPSGLGSTAPVSPENLLQTARLNQARQLTWRDSAKEAFCHGEETVFAAIGAYSWACTGSHRWHSLAQIEGRSSEHC
ncbi:hypothetical protein BAUCODRAFT_118489 [Baudoinia panamericana UAMH 10762]|uniref:Uncharacterized protein n=1 Tax=Baudoinia panamericana (strain UAMH 10762) TaxID=717646 RepID=M2NMJ8_BAUPA|nr:uncharacterized protein BAUCODRAFT_118489 [Baudoinia panamericana UAMH 10762]EMD00750.1 hypothetical protein BAUCODRAFT_118489 [Baudoinia panamericana UAMH 10762]